MTDRPQPRAVVPDGVTDPVTVGVDYGTLSGRALVVRVSDGAELGSAVCEYPHGVLDRCCPWSSPAATSGSAPTGPCRCPPTTSRCCKHRRARRRARPPGVDPAQVIGIATDFTACTMVPTTADGTPLCELPGLARRAARLRQALEAPRRPAPGRPDQRAGPRARRDLAGALRRGDLLGVGVRQGPRRCSRRPRRSTPPWSTGSRPPTGSSGSSRGTLRPQRLHRRLQGHLPGRRLPDAGLPRRAQPRLRGPSSSTSSTHADRPARRGRRPADRARPPRGPVCPRASRSRSATSTPTSPPPPRTPSAPGQMVADHGHLHLPRDEQRRARRGAGHVRRRRRRHHRRPLRLRGRPVRRRRHLRLVRRPPRCRTAYAAESAARGHRRARAPHRAGRRSRPIGAHGLVALDW